MLGKVLFSRPCFRSECPRSPFIINAALLHQRKPETLEVTYSGVIPESPVRPWGEIRTEKTNELCVADEAAGPLGLIPLGRF